MGLATLGTHTFRLDPESISWEYTIKSRVFDTVGGQVVQVFGASIEDMTVIGSFGAGGWQEQQAFLTSMQQIADAQADQARVSNSTVPPMHFRYPPKGWDFMVYLTAFTQVGGSDSVSLSNETFAPKWQLTLFVVEDNAGLKQVAVDQFIARVSEGIGWHQTVYNGYMTQADMEAAIGVGVGNYLQQQYGVGPSGGTGTGQ